MAWHTSGREVFLPDGSDANWTSAHRRELRARYFWREPNARTAAGPPPDGAAAASAAASAPPLLAPPSLRVRPPWYPRAARYLWTELTNPPWGAALPDGGWGAGRATGGGGGGGGGSGGGGVVERVILAPAWLVSLENGLGHKQKHIMYGATRPPPAVFVHFTCGLRAPPSLRLS